MRIIRPDDNHDHNNDDDRDGDDRGQGVPESAFSEIGDEVEDYLAHVLADVPPLDIDQPPPTPRRPARPVGPKRPALHLVPTDDESDTEPDDERAETVDPETVVCAGRAARRRMVRGAAGGSTVVLAAGVFAGWGESVVVAGPLAIYGAGWVVYLWWNAALRPSFPDTVTAITSGISRSVTRATVALSPRGDHVEPDAAGTRASAGASTAPATAGCDATDEKP